jgi:hypothetical protein
MGLAIAAFVRSLRTVSSVRARKRNSRQPGQFEDKYAVDTYPPHLELADVNIIWGIYSLWRPSTNTRCSVPFIN